MTLIRQHRSRLHSKQKVIFALSSLAILLPVITHAEVEFNTQFVHGAENITATKTLAENNGLSEGTFPYDIYLNDMKIESRDVEFKKIDGALAPCLAAKDLVRYGIHLSTEGAEQCYELARGVQGAKIAADPNFHRIDLVVPQASLTENAQGSIPTSAWDEGINAGFVSYNLSATRTQSSHYNATSLFGAFNSGINIGAWRFRNRSTASKSQQAKFSWNTISSWVERDLVAIRSRLLIGQSYTNDTAFDSIQFLGAQLSSDESMLPDSMRGFAPVVRGVAHSNATVEIYQNGYVIYHKTVAPGAFEIRDIYPSNQSGDLIVTVTEADGSKSSFSVPFSAVPNMLRRGNMNYQLTAGEYQDGTSRYQPKFVQATAGYGVFSGTTLFGGILLAENYRAAVAGIAQDIGPLGAVSLDATEAQATLSNGTRSTGQSYRFLYSKALNSLGTDFRLMGYRYSTEGYYSFADAVNEREEWNGSQYDATYDDPNQHVTYAGQQRNELHRISSRYATRRQRMEISVNQQLWAGSSLYVSASKQSYWGNSSQDRSIQLGFNSNIGRVTYGIYAQQTRSQYGYKDDSVNLTMSIPFNIGSHSDDVTLAAQHSKSGGENYSTSYSGTALDDDRLSYGVHSSVDSQGGYGAGMNADYRGSKGSVNGGFDAGKDYQSANLGASGGVVVHSGGVTLTQPLSDTLILVQAKGAQGMHVDGQSGVAIDGNGYAVLTSASPYHHNHVALRAEDIGAGMDIPEASKDIVPTSKAIGRVVFETYSGRNYLVHATLSDHNSQPPLGASVSDATGRNHGVVGAHGDLYVSGISDNDKLEVRWGKGANEHCYLTMPDNHGQPSKRNGYEELTQVCRAS